MLHGDQSLDCSSNSNDACLSVGRFGNSARAGEKPTRPVPIEDLGESSTDSDSSLWDSD